MSKEERFEWYYCDGIENMVVIDTITKSEYVDDNIANLLNQQDQEIQELKDSLYQANMELYKMSNLENENKELKKQLKNAIVPKFKVGQEVWCVRFMEIIKFKINKVEIYRGEAEEENRIVYGNWEDMVYQIEENCFATKEEAQAKLEELQGE